MAAASLALLATQALGPGARGLFAGLAPFLALYAGLSLLQAWRTERRRISALRRNMAGLERARRQAEHALQEKSRLLAVITHELRTPMNGVIGMAGLLRETPLTAEQESYVKAIESSGRSLLSIIDELLDASRLEAGEFEIARAPFDLTAMVEETAELLSPRAHARNIDLVCFIDPALDGAFIGDEARIRQVLANLAGNAIKFTDEGGVCLRVVPDKAAPGAVLFEIIDTGIGISARDQREIFRPYRQASGAGARRRGGTGLGLSISQRLVERMGGELKVESAPGEGARFFFSLPLPRREGAEPDAPPAPRGLDGLEIWLAIPEGPRRRVLADYVRAYGGRPCVISSAGELEEWLLRREAEDDSELICDASFADVLCRAASGGGGRTAQERVWLLLRPEERRAMTELMEGALAGFLLTPLRRRTFVFQIVERRLDARLERSARNLRRALAATRATHEGPRERPLALLAEDNEVNVMLARAMLEKAGYAMSRVPDGAGALEWMRRAYEGGEDAPPVPALVLMDVHMPVMDGLEAAQRIRALERKGGFSPVPILALTASSGRGERDRCLAAGMDGFLAKPFDLPALEEAVAKVLDRRRNPAGRKAPRPQRS